VVGRPVEIAAIRNQERLSPERVQNVDALFSFFCAESPATQGTLDLLQLMGIKTDQIDGLNYRGNGWPGHFAPHSKTAPGPLSRKTYRESWSFLQAYRPWASHIWPDGTGELADISCGDPWYHEPDNKNPGSSLVVVRTEKGRHILREAVETGYLELKPAEAWKLAKSQEGLIRKKGAVWGRLLVMRMMGLPSPYYQNAHLFDCWRKLSLEEKLRSTIGTARRIITRKLYRPLRLRPEDGVPVKPAMLGSATNEE
jgi:coenzyme F420 hydrogenase subunit beta